MLLKINFVGFSPLIRDNIFMVVVSYNDGSKGTTLYQWLTISFKYKQGNLAYQFSEENKPYPS